MSRFALASLEQRFTREADRFGQARVIQRGFGAAAATVEIAEYAVVALQDSWSRFTRDTIIRSSLGNATTASGINLRAGRFGRIRQREALDHIRRGWQKTLKPTWWEPRWFDVGDANHALDILLPQNANAISAAIGSSANPIEELRSLRNFAVHRLPATAAGVESLRKQLRAPDWRQPRDLIDWTVGGGEELFESWARRLRNVAAAAVK